MTDAEIAGYMDWRGPGAYTNRQLVRIRRIVEEVQRRERERIIAANAPEIEKVNAHIKALEEELRSLREFAAGRCTIQKVIDELGPMSLWSYAAMEKKLDEVRAEEREAVLDLVDDYAKGNTDLRDAIRARGQA
jgi:CHASE3 domain sensor protein